jgi:hypothetical protein
MPGCGEWASLCLPELDGMHGPQRFRSDLRRGSWQLPLRRGGQPALLALLRPELQRLLATEIQPPPPLCGRLRLEQRHRPTRQQFPHRVLHRLVPAIPANGSEVQHLAAIAEPAVAGRGRRPVAGLTAYATSGAQPRCWCCSSVQPLRRWLRCSPWAIGPGCRWQVSSCSRKCFHLHEAMAEASAGDGRKALVFGAVGLPWGGLGGDSCGGEQRMSLWRTGAAHGPSVGKCSGLWAPEAWGVLDGGRGIALGIAGPVHQASPPAGPHPKPSSISTGTRRCWARHLEPGPGWSQGIGTDQKSSQQSTPDTPAEIVAQVYISLDRITRTTPRLTASI